MSPRRTAIADRAVSTGNRNGHGAVDALVAPNGGVVQFLPVALIDPHPDNPREQLGELGSLVESIKSPTGLLQPLTVVNAKAFWSARGVNDTVDDGRYVVVAGHRRRAALEQAGRTEAPCLIRDDLAGDEAMAAMLVENLHREDLSELEEARGYAWLKEHGYDQKTIAGKVGKSQSHISKRLSLLDLPSEVLAEVGANGGIPVSEAQEIARYADDPEIVRAAFRRGNYETVDGVAKRIQEQRDQAKAIEAKVAELLAADPQARIAKWPESGFYDYAYPTGKVASLPQLRNAGVQPRDHSTLPCHAVAVGFRHGGGEVQVVDVCTDAQSHLKAKQDARTKADAARKRKEAKARETAEQQADTRVQLVKKALGARTVPAATRQVAMHILAEYLLDMFSHDDLIEFAARVFNIAVDEERPDYSAIGQQLRAQMQTTAGLDRLLCAAAFGAAEDVTGREYGYHGNDVAIAGPYMRWLQSLGHKPAGDERKLLAEPKR